MSDSVGASDVVAASASSPASSRSPPGCPLQMVLKYLKKVRPSAPIRKGLQQLSPSSHSFFSLLFAGEQTVRVEWVPSCRAHLSAHASTDSTFDAIQPTSLPTSRTPSQRRSPRSRFSASPTKVSSQRRSTVCPSLPLCSFGRDGRLTDGRPLSHLATLKASRPSSCIPRYVSNPIVWTKHGSHAEAMSLAGRA